MKTLSIYLKENLDQNPGSGYNEIDESRDASSTLKYPESEGVRVYNLFRQISTDPEIVK
jgi:hypothetical protein